MLLRVSGKLVWRVQRRSSSYCWRELTCWLVTCSDSLATSAGIAERIPMGPSDAISAEARSYAWAEAGSHHTLWKSAVGGGRGLLLSEQSGSAKSKHMLVA